MRFKEYIQDQLTLFPHNFDDFIPQNDPVRVINKIINNLDLSTIENTFKEKGCSAYPPKLLLKIIIYAYFRNTFSSRKIEDLTANDIRFMWLAGMHRPDHNTINNFRSGRLKGTLKEIFSQIVNLFVEENMVTLQRCYTDGTKIEANANRYSFVWGKSIHTRTIKIAEQLNELWAYAEQVCKDELHDRVPLTYQDISSEKIEGLVEEIEKSLEGKDIDKKVKSKIKRVKKDWPEQLKKNEQNSDQIGQRNSMSKTDPEATFMRMKEDHMANGQLKPAYNTQISSEHGFITNYSVHQSVTDTTTYIEHTEGFNDLYGHYPKESICDAGYGSEENYLYAREKGITPYIKYNYFHKEQKKNYRNDPFNSANFYYNKQKDCFFCPMGQPMYKLREGNRKTKNGFIQHITFYQAIRCTGCPLRCICHKSEENRIIQVNHRLNQLRKNAKELLLSPEGLKHRSNRPADVEQCFGNLKWNKKFKRFLLRGLEKVEIEFGLLVMAHNVGKYVVNAR